MVLEGLFNFIFGWTIRYLGSPWDVIVVSFIITFLITLSYKYLTDQLKMKELKDKMTEFNKKLKQDRTNQEVQNEFMKTQWQYMMHSWRPMIFTFLPLILIFNWMRLTFNSGRDIIQWSINIPLFGTGLGWLGTYIITSIIFSMIVRKFMRIH